MINPGKLSPIERKTLDVVGKGFEIIKSWLPKREPEKGTYWPVPVDTATGDYTIAIGRNAVASATGAIMLASPATYTDPDTTDTTSPVVVPTVYIPCPIEAHRWHGLGVECPS